MTVPASSPLSSPDSARPAATFAAAPGSSSLKGAGSRQRLDEIQAEAARGSVIVYVVAYPANVAALAAGLAVTVRICRLPA